MGEKRKRERKKKTWKEEETEEQDHREMRNSYFHPSSEHRGMHRDTNTYPCVWRAHRIETDCMALPDIHTLYVHAHPPPKHMHARYSPGLQPSELQVLGSARGDQSPEGTSG